MLATAIAVCQRAGVADVLVVLGHRADELRPVVEASGARVVLNPHFDQGMFGSVRAGAAALSAATDCCFELPVDIPLVRPQTLRALASAFAQGGTRIVYPVFAGRRGHPPLIARRLLQKAAPSDRSLQDLLAAHDYEARDLPVPDEAIHLDMDTAADYAALCRLAAGRDILSPAECEAILESRGAEQHLVEHSRAVARTASRFAAALNARGLSLDLRLVEAGALLHDIARGNAHHARSGAALLEAMGFSRVAAVVAAHMDLDFSDREISEAAVVFLADKLTRGVSLVSLEERFRPTMIRFRYEPEALAGAQERLATAEAVAAAVEARLGQSLTAALRHP